MQKGVGHWILVFFFGGGPYRHSEAVITAIVGRSLPPFGGGRLIEVCTEHICSLGH